MKMALKEAALVMNGTWQDAAPSGTASGASIDSREVAPGDLFFAIKGESQDGHQFVREAVGKGAAAAVCSRPVEGAGEGVILVDDTSRALEQLAGFHRDAIDPIVVGITGSAGKTSTKDLVAAVARMKYSTVAADRSYNSETGVPLTILKCGVGTEVLVCELGSRGIGHIRHLCEYVRPQVGIVTNVGKAHLEQFGGLEDVAKGKTELVEALPEGGSAVLNADDPLVVAMAGETGAQVRTFGTATLAWVKGNRLTVDPMGRPAFRITCQGSSVSVSLNSSGKHQMHNALAAAAAGIILGLSLDEIAEGLQKAAPTRWRMEVTTSAGVVLINDAYNSNPTSLRGALDTAAGVAAGKKLIVVLGYMAELGEVEQEEQLNAGRLAASVASRLIVVGPRARAIADGATQAGLADVAVVNDSAEALNALSEVREGDVVLVKGSRIAGLESVVPALAERLSTK
ncbi:MAG TPA: UDP-N-acetylmuramoyl-tripeptide--D-alanyl-D-alanine ligase [Actinomycetota bacterium]|nr:UDP-N-acetylmuramoyl-tripeptide--D-alanyl-D-alanine ligase [Actinomycetota bacterium]